MPETVGNVLNRPNNKIAAIHELLDRAGRSQALLYHRRHVMRTFLEEKIGNPVEQIPVTDTAAYFIAQISIQVIQKQQWQSFPTTIR